jgi:hypothetical protein
MSVVDGVPTANGGRSITIAAGSLGGSQRVPMVVHIGRPFAPPVDLFKFSAFKHESELGPLIARFAHFVRTASAMLETNVRKQIEAHSAAEGISLDELLAPLPFGLILIGEVEFIPPLEKP